MPSVEPGGPVFVVGLREVYEAVTGLAREVTKVSTELALLTHQQLDRDHDVTDHENRLRILERARWPLPSLAVIVSLGSLATALFVALRGG